MNKILFNFGLVASLISWSAVETSLKANAALISYTLRVDIDFGPFTGNFYTGSFSYDDDGLTGIDIESLPLSSFDFNFDGNLYNLADDPNATVSFFDGTFLGIDYAIVPAPSPTFISGTFDDSDAFFSYNLGGSGLGGTGIISYTRESIPVSIPESFSFIVFLLPLAYLMVGSLGKKNK